MTVRTAELLMAIICALCSIGLMVKSAELNIGWIEGRGPGAGAWPFWLAGGMLLASIVTMARWFLRMTPESRSLEPYMSRDTVTVVGISAGAILFLLVATHLVGMYLALLLFLLIPARPLINRVLIMVGHGELLPLAGIFLALGGAELFSLVNVKADLGALMLGVLIAGYPKATELYKSLISFKDLFLIAFFLSIGFIALPTLETLAVASLLALFLFVKFALFMWLFLFFRMQSRNAFLCALLLANYSEFGLIVGNMAVTKAWLSGEWLVTIALAVTISLILSNVLSKYSHKLYARFQHDIARLQFRKPARESRVEQPEAARIVVVGLGRVGASTYDSLNKTSPGCVLGVDSDEEKIVEHQARGRRVIVGDGEDCGFWDQIDMDKISLVMLAPPGIFELKSIIELLRDRGYTGKIACITRFEDERQSLLDIGADLVFNYFSEVGAGFAEEGKKILAI